MRELDDALAKMARREELERRLSEQAAEGQNGTEEVIEAIRRVVAQHPALAVRVWVQEGPAATEGRIIWSGGTVSSSVQALDTSGPGEPVPAPAPAPGWPAPAPAYPSGAVPGTGDAASRLAEMIRRDPSLLDTDRRA
ncbi:hypothetical protein AB0J86_11045 [Micromonospora sp. NPDC049559]|uniref:hypothetical protein n=1 Tax=Micromonospora sp. NPDC049559 TaxID=3155923 RepID=UPI0034471B73